MKLYRAYVTFFLVCCNWGVDALKINLHLKNGRTTLGLQTDPAGSLFLRLHDDNKLKLEGELGVNVPKPTTPCLGLANCFEGNGTRLHITTEVDDGFTIFWTVNDGAIDGRKFEDCFSLSAGQWYGGPERYEQRWPIQKLKLKNFANVLQEDKRGAIVEPYWLNSRGSYIFVNRRVPLFINQNTRKTRELVCFSAQVKRPYPTRNKLVLQYTIATQADVKQAHMHAVRNFLGKPTGHPSSRIIEKPIWSTWARYKRNINDSILLEFAQEIVDNGYGGQFEIDDDWEECYGSLSFNPKKFANINETIKAIKEKKFTVTLWVHPFVNKNCQKYAEIGRKHNFFVKNTRGSDSTSWWNSLPGQALHWDFTQPEVRNLYVQRLKRIQENHAVDSFKFDAGETSWVPQVSVLNGDPDEQPNNLAEEFVRMCAAFGDLIEVRVGWKTQDLPVFVRMLDKDSKWGVKNGLYTLITTLFQMNLNGYTMVLPDMVGGNGYGTDRVDAELFVRWVQANVFMPSIQFSYVPWDFESEEFDVKALTKSFVELHEKFSFYIIDQMKKSIEQGCPVNAPIWWVDPTNIRAQVQETEFMLGDDILVAPVVVKGARSRDVFLPCGDWYDPVTQTYHEGGNYTISNYSAPISVLPYFVRVGSEPYRVSKKL